MELKQGKDLKEPVFLTAFNRTAYGIETKEEPPMGEKVGTFNRTAYGIETFSPSVVNRWRVLLLIAPLMELKLDKYGLELQYVHF